ncbi:tectonic-2 isoform X2 [Macrotis lagotis]
MSDTSVSADLVGFTENMSLTLTVWDSEQRIIPIPDCGLENNRTDNWTLTVTSDMSGSEVTVTLNDNLESCVSEKDFFSDYPCIVETLLVSATHNSTCLAHLLIQVEIYPNASFVQDVAENDTVVPSQKFRPFGPCPCDLQAGVCDVRCCCDKECTPLMMDLFREDCYPGVFGGNVNPPYHHLCSTPVTEETPDWFPFLCIHSPLDNSPFLGHFFDGSVSSREGFRFEVPFPHGVKDWSDLGYKQDSAIMTPHKGPFFLPQVSATGLCAPNSPVAFLQDIDETCVAKLTLRDQKWTRNLTTILKNGFLADYVIPEVTYEETTDLTKYIRDTDRILYPGTIHTLVNLEEHYTFRWKEKTITGLNIKIIQAKIHPDQQGVLMQRFKIKFLSFNATESQKRSGNPGYYFGKPVRALNIQSENNATTLNLWRPDGRSLCKGIETTPILFGEDAVSGCLLEINSDDNCIQLREDVTNRFLSLVQATHVGKKGNTDYQNIKDWLKIIWEDKPFPVENIKGNCTDVPTVMTIRFLISNMDNLEGVPQNSIIGTEISFSSVTWKFVRGMVNANKPAHLPISVSVQFITLPYQPLKPPTSFQISHATHDCTHNDVCWSDLLFPLTEKYQGEALYSSLAKALLLAFVFTLILFLSSPLIQII